MLQTTDNISNCQLHWIKNLEHYIVRTNPHPQKNYIRFYITLKNNCHVVWSAWRPSEANFQTSTGHLFKDPCPKRRTRRPITWSTETGDRQSITRGSNSRLFSSHSLSYFSLPSPSPTPPSFLLLPLVRIQVGSSSCNQLWWNNNNKL